MEENFNNLTDEEIVAVKKQRSRNRIFGLLVGLAVVLVAIIVFEIVSLVA